MVPPVPGALSTAVDRMSFAHDIVMMTDEAMAIGIGTTDVPVKLYITFLFSITFHVKLINE